MNNIIQLLKQVKKDSSIASSINIRCNDSRWMDFLEIKINDLSLVIAFTTHDEFTFNGIDWISKSMGSGSLTNRETSSSFDNKVTRLCCSIIDNLKRSESNKNLKKLNDAVGSVIEDKSIWYWLTHKPK